MIAFKYLGNSLSVISISWLSVGIKTLKPRHFGSETIMKVIIQVAILLCLVSAFGAAKKLKCVPQPVLFPPCNLQLNETYRAFAFRILDYTDPAGGATCINGDIRYEIFGAGYGVNKNSSCCLVRPPSVELECNPQPPSVPTCPYNLGIRQNETIGDYFLRIGTTQAGGPTNGCCPSGTYKYVFPPSVTMASENICGCVIYNQAYTLEDPPSP